MQKQLVCGYFTITGVEGFCYLLYSTFFFVKKKDFSTHSNVFQTDSYCVLPFI